MIQKANAFRRNRLVCSVRDFLTGLGLFAIILTGTSYLPSRQASEPVPIFTARAYAAAPQVVATQYKPFAPQAALNRQADKRSATIILALVFASLVAFNLGLLRHLRRVYASPR